MSSFNDFVIQEARPLPVLLLADVSGSMADDGKIQSLNAAIRDMLQTFAKADEGTAEIHVAVIVFGARTGLHLPLQPASKVVWDDVAAGGLTPLGIALDTASQVIESVPRRAYRPTVVLVSDGQPTDKWEEPFRRFTEEGRTAKVDRYALGIGVDADFAMLDRFGSQDRKAFKAADARQIKQFFRFVSQTVTVRSTSANPNEIPSASAVEGAYDDDDDF
jgi:uncharacterized protein YegL